MPRNNRANILTQIGRFTDALIDADVMMNLKPKDKEPWLVKARILLGLEKIDDAKKLLKQGIETEGLDK